MVVNIRVYIIRRLLLIVPVIIGVTLLIFTVLQLLTPYQRASAFVMNPQDLRPENINRTIKFYHLDDPVWVQYQVWLGQTFSGHLGVDRNGHSIAQILINRAPATVELAIFASFIIVLAGIWQGTIAARRKDRMADHATRVAAISGYSLPTFWLGLLLLAFLYGGTGRFGPGVVSTSVYLYTLGPEFTRYTGMYTIDGILNGDLFVTWDALEHLVLPVLTLSFVSWAIVTRIMRSSMIEALGRDYVRFARAKGVPERIVVRRHARRNALIPVATVSGLIVAGLLNGVVITETVFGRPGIGEFAASAAVNLDIAAVLGFTLVTAFLIVIANLVVDIMYAYIDPRVRLE